MFTPVRYERHCHPSFVKTALCDFWLTALIDTCDQHKGVARSCTYSHQLLLSLPGETFVLGDGLPGPLEPRLDPLDSALNAVSASSPGRNSRDYRIQGYSRHLHQPSSLTQCSNSALQRLSAGGKKAKLMALANISLSNLRFPALVRIQGVEREVNLVYPGLGRLFLSLINN